jgi:hypothetical protein
MTAVLPPRPTAALPVGEDHLVAWIAGYLAACASIEQAAYEAGRRDALRAVAVNVAELDIIGGAKDRRFLREAAARIRARREAHDERARQLYELHGRTEYRGGPVPAWGGEAA